MSTNDFQLLVTTTGLTDVEGLDLALALRSPIGSTFPGLTEINLTDFNGTAQMQFVPSAVALGQAGESFGAPGSTLAATNLYGEAITVSVNGGASMTGSAVQAATAALLNSYVTIQALDGGATVAQASAAAPAAVAQIHNDALLFQAIEGQSPAAAQLPLLAQASNDAFVGLEMTFMPAIRNYIAADDPAGFITAIYENAVGRIPEPGAIPFYEKVIAASPNAAGWYQTIEYIGLSAEAHAHAVTAGSLFA